MTHVLLNGDQMKQISGNDSIILSYPELYKYKSIENLFNNGINKVIILYLQEKHENNMMGHWCLLTKYLNQNKVCFYDPYGFMPDSQLKWNDKEERIELNQEHNYLTLLLYNYSKNNGKVEYNEMKFQKKDPSINTCGRHVSVRAHFFNIPLETYQHMFKRMRNKGFDLDNLIVLISDLLYGSTIR